LTDVLRSVGMLGKVAITVRTALTDRLLRSDAEIAFADSGSTGPAVVLTHGAGLDHTMFDAQARALTEHGYRVVVWDLRGHGQSRLMPGIRFTATDALGDLAAVLDECQLASPILVGHSLGGNLTQTFTRDHPNRVAAHIVMDATCNFSPLSALDRWSLSLAAPLLGLVPARTLPGIMARASAVTPRGIALAEDRFARMPKPAFLDVWRATVSLLVAEPDYRSTTPLALLRGDRDRTGNIATTMPRWARAEGIAETVIPGAGHVVTWDAPHSTSVALLRILGEWAPGGASADGADVP
jgi:pimeloyl-ACP methyl ester carboxylesterase